MSPLRPGKGEAFAQSSPLSPVRLQELEITSIFLAILCDCFLSGSCWFVSFVSHAKSFWRRCLAAIGCGDQPQRHQKSFAVRSRIPTSFVIPHACTAQVFHDGTSSMEIGTDWYTLQPISGPFQLMCTRYRESRRIFHTRHCGCCPATPHF